MKIIFYILSLNLFAYAGISQKDRWAVPSVENKPLSKIVAIIDTGVDLDHKMIRPFLWSNPGEVGQDEKGQDKRYNGVDDDGNGYVDDVHGWNFLLNEPAIQDQHGHGTHVAGLIAHGEFLNSFQNTRSENAPQLMILKFFDEDATPERVLAASVEAIEYAVKMNAAIINYSGGGQNKSLKELLALYKAQKAGLLIVAAAGNEQTDLDRQGFYPASYPLESMIRVAAMKDRKTLLDKSNFGKHTVDLAAPGYRIISSAPGNALSEMTGTSQATALVSGLAARAWSQHPGFDAVKVKEYLLKQGHRELGLKDKVRGERVAVGLDL